MAGFKHFFVPPLIQSRELTVRGMGVRESMPPIIVNRPAGCGDYFFLYGYQKMCLRGIYTDQEKNCEPHHLIVWDPVQGHFYGNLKRNWMHTWIHCDGTLVARWLRQTKMPCNTPFVVSDPSIVEESLLHCYREMTRSSGPDERIVGNILENFIRGLAREAKRAPSGEVTPAPFIEVRHYLQLNFSKSLRLEDLATRIHLSVPHFCTEFKRYFKVAPIEYLIQLRLRQSVYLLRNRNMRIGEIAEHVGYTDVYHFSKLFKKHYGISPLGMRSRLIVGKSQQD